MIGSKEVTRVRIEIDLDILIGELDDLERDFDRVSISRLVAIWEPEIIESRIMAYLKEEIRSGKT